MTSNDRQALLAVRLLDDCAYQANIRKSLIKERLIPKKHSDVQLNEMVPELVSETEKRMNIFYQKNISWFSPGIKYETEEKQNEILPSKRHAKVAD